MSAATNPLSETRDRLRALWNARQPRERLFLVAMAGFLACALLAQGLWSAHNARTRLHRQIPQLRQQAEVVQRQAGEVRQLKAQPINVAAQEGPALISAAMSAAGGVGLTLTPGQLQLEGSRQVRLRASLAFDPWLEWVAVLQRDARLHLVRCRVETGDRPGIVKVDVLFALPEPS